MKNLATIKTKRSNTQILIIRLQTKDDKISKISMVSFIGNGMLLMLLLLLAITTYTCGISKKHARITNELGGDLTLTVHCKSKDDDIGVKVLPPRASFEFSFRPLYFFKTQFYCSFEWPGQLNYFDIYVDTRDRKRCRNCFWDVHPDGPCMYGKCSGWNMLR